MKLYVASSWRNLMQPAIVSMLRNLGHEVYDFRNPDPGDKGFQWSAIDPEWKEWDTETYHKALEHPVAESGYGKDWNTMEWADGCVLVLPSGRSAHIEAGYFVGAGKPLHIVWTGDDQEPELMYKMATALHADFNSLLDAFGMLEVEARERMDRARESRQT